MVEEEEMEDEDEDDVDFNPYLQRSPSLDGGESGESWKRGGREQSEEAEEDGVVSERQEDGIAETEEDEDEQILRESDQFIGEFDGDDTFFELASDGYEEEDCEDDDPETVVHDQGDRDGLKLGKYSTKIDLSGQVGDNVEGRSDAVDNLAGTCGDEDETSHEKFGDVTEPPDMKDICARRIVPYTHSPEHNVTCPSPRNGKQPVESLECNQSKGEAEDTMDAISKRTRAHYSLADMSLDQLEMFLQESDEEEYFQNVDDEEEYRKFLVAVQESEDHMDGQREQGNKKGDEDDEEDVDFEVEIEEAFESDDTSESVRKRKRRRPETREKRRQRAQLQTKGPYFGQSTAPLRHLLPHVGNLADEFSCRDKRKTKLEMVNRVWPPNVKAKAPVNGFTAHQIGQLYCLIHEHVQLLVQVFSLCVLDPARQQLATDTHRMLMELVEKRELLLSWKKTAFPDFCFRPPYTHPSLVEDKGDNAPGYSAWSPSDICTNSTTFFGQSTPVSSSSYPGYFFLQGSASDPRSSVDSSQSFHRKIPLASLIPTRQEGDVSSSTVDMDPESYFSSRVHDSTSLPARHFAKLEHLSQRRPETSLPLQESIHPVSPWIPGPDHGQIKHSAVDGVSSSHIQILPRADYNVVPHPPELRDDSTSLSINTNSPSSTYPEHVSAQVASCDHEEPITSNMIAPEPLLPGTAPNATPSLTASSSTDSMQTCKSSTTLPREQSKVEWAPVTAGPVRSLLDVAPLSLVREYLMDVSHVVQEYRQRHVESGAYHSQCEREPLFVMSVSDDQDQTIGRTQMEGRSWLSGGGEFQSACVPRPHIKKTMAAALVESTKKQSLALVPKAAATAVQRFLPFFNKVFFPHKPPPVATASRLLFTDAEDELLAMGLMMYNTDWKAIQQRFLPSKSMHQIFVRQKNRSSARAPENSIKAVRRMKSSPLTSSEKTLIQEGLGMFKYDWNKVWQYCVPHRDPAVLPRQWRIAVGTQKSYKTSETSKERRRLYEANRRQLIAAKKASDKAVTINEVSQMQDGHPSCSVSSLECRDGKSMNGNADDLDTSYIREAFLADWCPTGTPIVAAVPMVTSVERRQRKSTPSLPKKKKAKVEMELHLSNPSLWPGSQTVKALCQSRKQTVKLAPGLPSVKLPPRVHVLSQSHIQTHQPFPLANRLKPVTSQWVQMTGKKLEKLKLSVQGPHWPSSSLPSSAKEPSSHQVNLQAGAYSSQQSIVPSNHSVHSQVGQTITSLKKSPPAMSAPSELQRSIMQGPTELLKRKPKQARVLPSIEKDKGQSLLLQPTSDSALVYDLSSQSLHHRGSVSHSLQHSCGQFYPFRGESTGSGFPSIQISDSLPKDSRKGMSTALPMGQFEADCQGQVASSPVTPVACDFPTQSGNGHVSQSHAKAFTGTAADDVGVSYHQQTCPSGFESGSSPPPGSEMNLNGMCTDEVISTQSEVQLGMTLGQIGKRYGQESATQGEPKTRRNLAKRNKKSVTKETRNVTPGNVSSSVFGRVSGQLQPILVVEGVIHDIHQGSRRYRAKSMRRNHSRKSQKVENRCIETGIETGRLEAQLEQQVIVMEQEELSDSEDEADAGVLFEHEEMGDSDKDAESELNSARQSRTFKSK